MSATPTRLLGFGADALRAELAATLERAGRGAGTLRDLAGRGGAPAATTPREAVHTAGNRTLYHYAPERPRGLPLLIVYALVNRADIVDLHPGRSLVQGLLEAGLDVYLVDWGDPGVEGAATGLADYVADIGDCVDRVAARHGVSAVNLLGVCQGGTLSLCYSALQPHRVANLVTMVTPVDFHVTEDLLGRWVREIDVERLVARYGNVPNHLLDGLFVALRPFHLALGKYLDGIDRLDDEQRLADFLRMERWIHDGPDQAGAAFGQFVRRFYHDNALLRGGLELGGRRVDLAAIDMPLLNLYAEADHIVPPASSRALAGRTASRDYTELPFPGGHIGVYVSRHADAVPRQIAAWLAERSPVAGGAP